MRKLSILLIGLFLGLVANSQFPIQQNLGSSSTLVSVPTPGALRASLINRTFTDTTAANLTNVRYYPFLQIATTSDYMMWFRSVDATAWIPFAGSSGGTGGNFWGVTGNFFPSIPSGFGLGTNSTDNLPFKTSGVNRVILPLGGLAYVNDTTANKVMTFNPSTKAWNYGSWFGSGGGGSAVNVVDSMGFIDMNLAGALPDDGIDDTPIIQAALNSAGASTSTHFTLYFRRPGVYNIDGALQTSVNGVNPNCQLYLPLLTDTVTVLKRIKILGANAPHFLTSGVGGANSPNSGVIFKSGIIGSGSSPYVIGSPWFAEAYGDWNEIAFDMENITIITRTKTGATQIAPTMSGIDLSRVFQTVVDNVKIITETPITDLVTPVGTGTIGIKFPAVNNRGINELKLSNISGYEIGIVIAEHFYGEDLFFGGAAKAVYVNPGNHANYIASLTAESCITAIYSATVQDLTVSNYQCEHVTHGKYYDFVYDVQSASTGRVTILHAQAVTAGVGPISTLTNSNDNYVDVASFYNKPNIFYGRNGAIIEAFTAFSTNDAILMKNNSVGGTVAVRNLNASGYSAVSLYNNSGTAVVGLAYNNASPGQFFINNEVSGGSTAFKFAGTDKFKVWSDSTNILNVSRRSNTRDKVVVLDTITGKLSYTDGGSGISGTIADGQVGFGSGTSLAGSNNFKYNTTNSSILFGGVTPSTWSDQSGIIEGTASNIFFGQVGDLNINSNGVYNTGWTYKANGKAAGISMYDGDITFRWANTGTAGNAITWVDALKIDDGNTTITGTTNIIGATTIKRSNAGGAVFDVQNTSATGFSGIQYLNDGGTVQVFTGFNNSDNREFRINNVASNGFITFKLAGVDKLKVFDGGNIGIGGASGAAALHLPAGTATASTAPLKFTSGTNLTTAEAGAMEYNGTSFFLSPSTTRLRVVVTDNSIPSNGMLPIGNGTNYTNATITQGAGIAVTNGAGTITIASTDEEGTYTPTLTNTTNIAASTAATTYYKRSGDWIYVWGTVDIDATTALTISEMGMSLPVASGVGGVSEIAGTGAFEDNTVAQLMGDVTNDRVKWRFTPQTGTNNKYSFHYSYKWIAP